MKNTTDIKFQKNKIIINDEIVYDFENRYNNISALGVEQQLQIYSELINSISKTALSTSDKIEYMLIYAYLFKILSVKNAPASFLIIGNIYFMNIVAEIINLFNNANKLYHIIDINNYNGNNNCKNLTTIFSGAICTDFLANNNFSAVLIDLNFIKSNINAVFSEYNRLLDRNGTIICYGSNVFMSDLLNIPSNADTRLYQLNPERFLISVSFNNNIDNTFQNSAKEEVLAKIEQESARLLDNLQYIMSNRPTSLDDIWHRIIDDCIYIIDKIESIITKNYLLFENEDLKYQTNEVKNALLDFKYEAYLNRKHYDFFKPIYSIVTMHGL